LPECPRLLSEYQLNAGRAPSGRSRSGGEYVSVSTRQFAVKCAIGAPPSSDVPPVATDQLREELLAGGLEEVVVVPDAGGNRFIIRGLAPAESKEAARELVEDQIYDATLDLIILEPGGLGGRQHPAIDATRWRLDNGLRLKAKSPASSAKTYTSLTERFAPTSLSPVRSASLQAL
jgi:hypothetical protein